MASRPNDENARAARLRYRERHPTRVQASRAAYEARHPGRKRKTATPPACEEAGHTGCDGLHRVAQERQYPSREVVSFLTWMERWCATRPGRIALGHIIAEAKVRERDALIASRMGRWSWAFGNTQSVAA